MVLFFQPKYRTKVFHVEEAAAGTVFDLVRDRMVQKAHS